MTKKKLSLRERFESTDHLEPKLPDKGWKVSDKMLQLRRTMARLYWGKRAPIEYFKVLCATCTTQLGRKEITIKPTDVIFAQGTIDTIHTNMLELYRAGVGKYRPDVILGGPLVEYTGLEWAQGRSESYKLLPQLQTMWTLACAAQSGIADTDRVTLDTMDRINKEMSKWIAYVESISRILDRD